RRPFAHSARLPLGGVAVDQLAFDRALQYRREQSHRHVDRARREGVIFGELRGDVALHGVERDPVQRHLAEPRDQVDLEAPSAVRLRARRYVDAVAGPPFLREGMEGRDWLGLRRRLGFRSWGPGA